MLISLVAATAVAAAIVWAPAPSGWVDGDAPVGGGSPPAPTAAAEPQSVRASAATAHIQFAVATAPDATLGAADGAAPPPKPPPGPPILVGLTDGSPQRFAYVLNDGQTTRAGLWDKVGKWRVTAIGPRGITLSAGRQTLVLALYGPRPAPPPPVAAVDASPLPPPTESAPTRVPAPPRARALEPASAPSPHETGGHGPHYWAGPANRAPPGYILLKPGQAPPTP